MCGSRLASDGAAASEEFRRFYSVPSEKQGLREDLHKDIIPRATRTDNSTLFLSIGLIVSKNGKSFFLRFFFPNQLTLSLTTQARNSEKAQSMLFRFRAQQAASLGILDISRTRRPKAITSITSIPICEKWRGQVLKEISRKVSKIQEPSLSDFQIRDLNDEINKLMREKHIWEHQIRGLGGPNYMRGGGGRVLDEEGREVEGGGRGYRFVAYLFLFFLALKKPTI